MAFQNETKKTILLKHNLVKQPSHDIIRLVEQENATSALLEHGSVDVVSGWGYGKSGFLYSFIHDNFEDHTLFYSDLKNCLTVNETANKIKTDIGIDISLIFTASEIGKAIVIIDNITCTESSIIEYLREIASLSVDYNKNVKVVFLLPQEKNISPCTVLLSPLSIEDIQEYLRGEQGFNNITRENLDSMLEISSGLTIKLDKIKEIHRLMSVSEIINDGKVVIAEEDMTNEIPSLLLKQINRLEIDNPNLYLLLQIFSAFDCGERLKNIRDNFSENKFDFESFAKLERMVLIHTIKNGDEKILKINPLIKDFMSSKINPDLNSSLIKKCLDISLGSNWMSGKIKVTPVIKFMLRHTEFYPGNVHSLIKRYFDTITLNLSERNTNGVMLASVGYCMFLSSNDYFKELVSFSRMVFGKIKHLDCNEKFIILRYLAYGLRMIDEDSECVHILEPELEVYIKKSFYQKNIYTKMLVTLMYAYEELDKSKSLTYAKKVKKIADTNSGELIHAEVIIVEHLISVDVQIKKLKALNKKARKYGFITVANNICLKLFSLTNYNNEHFVDAVIDSKESGIYSKVRALVSKYEVLISNGNYDSIKKSDYTDLVQANYYLFTQRLDGLFNRCSSVLWKIAIHFSDIDSLEYLFRLKSIIFRVTLARDKELRYADELYSIREGSMQAYTGQTQDYLSARLKFLNKDNSIFKLEG